MAYYGLFTAYYGLFTAYYGLFTANTMQLLENAIHH